MICKRCGKFIESENAKFCTNCGNSLFSDSDLNAHCIKKEALIAIMKKQKKTIFLISCFAIVSIIVYFYYFLFNNSNEIMENPSFDLIQENESLHQNGEFTTEINQFDNEIQFTQGHMTTTIEGFDSQTQSNMEENIEIIESTEEFTIEQQTENPFSVEVGATNIINGGYACYDGMNYYYSDEQLYQNNINESPVKIWEGRAYYLNSVGEYLYFVNADNNNCICRIKKDGSDFTTIYNQYCYELTYYNNWLYFSCVEGEERTICRMKPDGSQFTILINCQAWYMNIYQEHIYFCNFDDGLTLYIINLDGTNPKKLYTGEISDICVAENRIFFSADRKSRHLYSMNLDGTDLQELNSIYTSYTNCYDRKLYFVSDDNKMYICNLDGSDIRQLFTEIEDATFPIILPNVIYYENSNKIVCGVRILI